MKGILKKDKDKWVVEYEAPAIDYIGKNTLEEIINTPSRKLPLHPDDVNNMALQSNWLLENTEVEFEIVDLYKETTYDQPDKLVGKYAKLIQQSKEDRTGELGATALESFNKLFKSKEDSVEEATEQFISSRFHTGDSWLTSDIVDAFKEGYNYCKSLNKEK